MRSIDRYVSEFYSAEQQAVIRMALPGILAQHKQDLLYALAREAVCLADHDMLRAEAVKAVQQ